MPVTPQCGTKANALTHEKVTFFPYQFNCLCWKIALDIALLDVTSASSLALRE